MVASFYCSDVVAVTKKDGLTQVNFKDWWIGTGASVSDVMGAIGIARERAIAAAAKATA
jgi:hypothetical protein